MTTPFDFINAITYTKEDLFGTVDDAEKSYVPHLVNRGLSMAVDTVLYANEMNRWPNLPKDMQFNYLINTIPKRNRRLNWAKKSDDTYVTNLVMEYYGYSIDKARQVRGLLSQDQLEIMERRLYKGGLINGDSL